MRQSASTWQEKAVDWMALVGSRMDGCQNYFERALFSSISQGYIMCEDYAICKGYIICENL